MSPPYQKTPHNKPNDQEDKNKNHSWQTTDPHLAFRTKRKINNRKRIMREDPGRKMIIASTTHTSTLDIQQLRLGQGTINNISNTTLIRINLKDNSSTHARIKRLTHQHRWSIITNKMKMNSTISIVRTRRILPKRVRNKTTSKTTRLLDQAYSLNTKIRIIPRRWKIINPKGNLTVKDARKGMTLENAQACIPNAISSNPGLLVSPFSPTIRTFTGHALTLNKEGLTTGMTKMRNRDTTSNRRKGMTREIIAKIRVKRREINQNVCIRLDRRNSNKIMVLFANGQDKGLSFKIFNHELSDKQYRNHAIYNLG